MGVASTLNMASTRSLVCAIPTLTLVLLGCGDGTAPAAGGFTSDGGGNVDVRGQTEGGEQETGSDSGPPISSAARIVNTIDGNDWSLPDYVAVTPYSGYISGGDWADERSALPRYQDGHIHVAHYTAATWAEINPAEGVYDFSKFDGALGEPDPAAKTGVIPYVRSYSRDHFPDWLVQKANLKFLPNGAVAAWDPQSGYQDHYGQLLQKIGDRYRDHPRLVAVDMRGLDHLYGEWGWRGNSEDYRVAVEQTGLTPDTFQAWGIRYVQDYVDAFVGQEHKLVWMNGEDTFISKSATDGVDYGPASRAIWQAAYDHGCGGRDGMPTVWHRYITAGFGNRHTDEGYLEFDEAFAPVKNGTMWYTENTEYFADDETWKENRFEFGGEANNPLRFFISTMRVLQMRRNWQWVSGRMMGGLEAADPDFMVWVDYQMGKTPGDSPDAWAWLREGYLASWAHEKPVKNFERWIMQRDIEPDGHTQPDVRVDISMYEYNYASGKGYEFHARRTDLGTGQHSMYFRAEPLFVADTPTHLLLKVTYLDGPATTWDVEYTGTQGQLQTPTVETKESGDWKTVTFEITGMKFDGALSGDMDFAIKNRGDADLTVKLVRLVKGSR